MSVLTMKCGNEAVSYNRSMTGMFLCKHGYLICRIQRHHKYHISAHKIIICNTYKI